MPLLAVNLQFDKENCFYVYCLIILLNIVIEVNLQIGKVDRLYRRIFEDSVLISTRTNKITSGRIVINNADSVNKMA